MGFLQIASWNIEHLSGQPRERRRQSAYALADHIEMAGIHVLALQEIYVTEFDEEVRLTKDSPPVPRRCEGQRRNSDLDIVCYLIEEHSDDDDALWKYQILENRNANDESQLCAVMWDTKRVTLKNIVPLPVTHRVGEDNLWDRKPHLLEFSSNHLIWRRDLKGTWKEIKETRSFSLVPLHMKSNFGGVTENRRVRGKEAITLCAELKNMEGKIDPSLILIGDTNILSNEEPAVTTFLDNNFVDLNNNDTHTYWSSQYNGAPFDRAFVAKNRLEFRYTRQYILRSSDLMAHDRFLSDHYMIKMSVKDYVDDADARGGTLP